jgi:hypothetical protein
VKVLASARRGFTEAERTRVGRHDKTHLPAGDAAH